MSDCSSYYPGQCTAGACEWSGGWIPNYLGDGGDWAANYAAQGGGVTMDPTVGAVVCYARGDGYSDFGHVAGVTAVFADGTFQVHEMNYIAPYEWDDRVSSSYDVAGFLLPPGVAPGSGASLGRGSGPQGWPSGAQDFIAAYDQLRWYWGVTVNDQVAALQGTVALGYQV